MSATPSTLASAREGRAPLNDALRLDLYRSMARIRAIEQGIARHYADQEMRCPVHLSVGQEAAAVGACAALRKSDFALSGHRSHSHYLGKGGNLKSMMAEIYGKATGCAGGKGGSMHLIDLEAGFLGAVPIVGSTIPIAAGVALAAQMRGDDNVTMIFLGEGATETGVFYETVNFAGLKNLPMVFLVENNFFSVYSPMDVRQKGEDRILDIARAHGIEAHRGDGNDVEQVYRMSKVAVDKARAGGGPSLLEFTTYRWLEHCGPNYDNDIGYRTEEEFQQWKARDPLPAFEASLLKAGVATSAELDAVRKASDAEIEDAIAYAKAGPWPEVTTMGLPLYAPPRFKP